jgi:hypothetical protein
MPTDNCKIIYHFSLLYDIVLFGKTDNEYFICVITKFQNKYKKTKHTQSAACIYIQDNDEFSYCIQVSLLSDKNSSNKPLKEWFLEMTKKNAPNIYDNLIHNSSDIKIKSKNNKFCYIRNGYDIPNYIWCVVTGMILTEL